jgi:hypothetical protein
MQQTEICIEAVSRANPSDVFRLLRDGSTWPQWSLFDDFQLEREGSADPLGIGAIRVFSTRVSKAREEVVEVIRNRRFSYVLRSGLPLNDYRADVDLIPMPCGGTTIRWQSTYYPRQRALSWFWRWFMTKILRDVGRQLARAAEDPELVALAEKA